MSDTPNEIWCDTGLYYDYKTDWSEGSWRNNDNCGGVKYVRADRIEELEAKLQDQTHLIEQLFALLDVTEETEEGNTFKPNQIRSCRALDAEKFEEILGKLKEGTDA